MAQPTGSRESTGTEILKAVEGIESAEKDIDRTLSGLASEPDPQQKLLLEDLNRLLESLRGPEDALDKGSYNRPFPPRHAARHR